MSNDEFHVAGPGERAMRQARAEEFAKLLVDKVVQVRGIDYITIDVWMQEFKSRIPSFGGDFERGHVWIVVFENAHLRGPEQKKYQKLLQLFDKLGWQ